VNSDDPQFELYHPELLAYARVHPLFRERNDARYVVKAYNPYCGDKFEVHFDLTDGVVTNATFFGYGCIISKASTGLLTEVLANKTIRQAVHEIRTYLNSMKNTADQVADDPPYRHLMVARKYPGRVRCATLAWEALLQSEVIVSRLTTEGN
jgi:nitrogen fixation NifU-like protein